MELPVIKSYPEGRDSVKNGFCVFSGLPVMMSLESMLVTNDGSVNTDASGHRTFFFFPNMHDINHEANLSSPSTSHLEKSILLYLSRL